jgi:hypothetical protein
MDTNAKLYLESFDLDPALGLAQRQAEHRAQGGRRQDGER